MKLLTEIKPRRDGTVRATAKDGTAYVFTPDANGDLTCDVHDEALVAALLATENFWPVDQADYESAVKLVKPVVESQANADAAASGENDEDDGDEADDEADDEAEPNMNALPVEAKTPPAAKPAKKVSAKPAKKAA